jgi:hypothetical protein
MTESDRQPSTSGFRGHRAARPWPFPAAAALAIVVVIASAAVAAESVEQFVRRHWANPLAPQGPPPPTFGALESSLHPEACGTCHPVQLGDWRTSVHAGAMGPGIAGQLIEMAAADPASPIDCHVCHAPLAEQSAVTRTRTHVAANPTFDTALRGRGVVCAACHVRGHERFGPPRRDGSLASPTLRDRLPHRGVTRTPAFLSSEFCRGCHQSNPDGLALNGKLLQNTYEEWKASPFARRGVQCQDCHMPDRRHLWRGIHDETMVRSGLDIAVTPNVRRLAFGQVFALTLEVHNARVGHVFPTYVTPRVVLRGELVGLDGEVVAGSRQEQVIAREVTVDVAREVFDTRLAPGQRASFTYRGRADRPGLRARLSVVVYPDEFYTRFFETLLEQGAGQGEAQIREALAATRRSAFTVFARDVRLD